MAFPEINKIIVQQNVRRGGGFFMRSPSGGSGRRGLPGRRRPGGWKRILSYLLIIGSATFLAGTISFIGLVAWFARALPDPNNLTERAVAETTRIYDHTDKNLLYEIHGDEKRTVVGLDQISPDVIHATVAVEDKDFYAHGGVSLKHIIGSLYADVIRGGKYRGGSTITQQFIKNSVLTNEKTLTRKLKEIILSFEVERRFSKDDILKLYFNEIPYGSVAYGIEAASETFFGKHAKDVTLSEAAVLASIPNAPTYYSPYGSHADELLARSRLVLGLMRQQGYITEDQEAAAKADDPLTRIIPKNESIIAPHFVFYVREQLTQQFGEQTVDRGGLHVITTLDVDKQKLAEAAIASNRDNLKKWKSSTAAGLAINPRNGEVLAMVGSADYFDDAIHGKFNALEGNLQPGSSIKPLVYAAAFEKGYTPDTVLYDVKTTFKNQPTDYTPSNYDGNEHGPVTMRQALAGSLNIPAVETLYLTGIDRVIDFLGRFGYSTLDDRSRYGLSLVLGGLEVRPIEHIAAYGAFANDGILYPTKAILKVTDKNGKTLLDNTDSAAGTRVIDEEISRQVTSILSDNAARSFIFGEKNFLTLGNRPVAAKTGTTNKFYDAWAIGYTPSLLFGVWTGNADHSAMKVGADGSKIAAPIWNQFMTKALGNDPIEQFIVSQPVVTGKPILDGQKSGQAGVNIDKISGKLSTDLTPKDLVEQRFYGVPHSILYFVDKENPRGPVPDHPENDPQFANWESGVADWAMRQHIDFGSPPTETDDIHIPENVPTVTIISPSEGTTVPERTMTVAVTASARRGVAKVEYRIDDQSVSMFEAPNLDGTIVIPNMFGKGFHTLTAIAFDDVGNRASVQVNFNLTADAAPIDITWQNPSDFQSISAAAGFPLAIRFAITDPRGITTLAISATSQQTRQRITLGEADHPQLSSFSFTWKDPPSPGRYTLTVDATMSDGEHTSRAITVDIR